MYLYLVRISCEINIRSERLSRDTKNSVEKRKSKERWGREGKEDINMTYYNIISLSCHEQVSLSGLQLKLSIKLLLLEVCKNHYRKENISVDGSKQGRDTLFWINLKETWLNVSILL